MTSNREACYCWCVEWKYGSSVIAAFKTSIRLSTNDRSSFFFQIYSFFETFFKIDFYYSDFHIDISIWQELKSRM